MATKKLATINIKGKEYVMVKDRIVAFNEMFKNGSIRTEIKIDDNLILCRAVIMPDASDQNRIFTAYAEEDRTSTMINKTSAVENAETSAVGRALAMMGIGIVDSVASYDEIRKSENREFSQTSDKPASEAQISFIAKLSKELGIEPPEASTIAQASKVIGDLNDRIKKMKEKNEPFE